MRRLDEAPVAWCVSSGLTRTRLTAWLPAAAIEVLGLDEVNEDQVRQWLHSRRVLGCGNPRGDSLARGSGAGVASWLSGSCPFGGRLDEDEVNEERRGFRGAWLRGG